MAKMKGGKKIKIKNFPINFGYIIISIFALLLIFLIGRAIGKKEEKFDSNRRYTEDMNNKLLNRRLMLLNQI